MKNLTEYFDELSTFNKIEFGVATIIFIFSILLLDTSDAAVRRDLFVDTGTPFGYYRNFFYPQVIDYIIIYLAFLLINFIVVPQLLRKEGISRNMLLVVVAYVVAGLVFSITDTYATSYLFNEYPTEQDVYNRAFQAGFWGAFQLLAILGVYTAVKYTAHRLFPAPLVIRPEQRPLMRDISLAAGVWLISVFLLLVTEAEGEIVLYWAALMPFSVILYFYSQHFLIPKSLTQKRPFWSYVLRVMLFLILGTLPVFLFIMVTTHEGDEAVGFCLFNAGFQLLITAPLSWILYKRRAKSQEEIGVLQTELGQSTANLDFLRSQINPHFLFNTLNTLYGTALQENSERTAQGIQMLGDMMRFMLHENHQRQILLTREVEYMRNYIELQSLRTSASPNISLETSIEDVLAERWIAPMLLIPFVENAFKHGISLKRKSWIRITLHYEADKLYFDVYNSTHPRHELDLEKDQSGVGLENVRQRLALLYPGKHELAIRQTPQEFFVHLTLQLGGSAQQ